MFIPSSACPASCILQMKKKKKGIVKMSPNSFIVTQLGSDGGRIWTWGNLDFPILLCHLPEAQVWWSPHPLFSSPQKSRVAVCSVCCLARTVYFQPRRLWASHWELGVPLHRGSPPTETWIVEEIWMAPRDTLGLWSPNCLLQKGFKGNLYDLVAAFKLAAGKVGREVAAEVQIKGEILFKPSGGI